MAFRHPTLIKSMLRNACAFLGYSTYFTAHLLFLSIMLPCFTVYEILIGSTERIRRRIFHLYLKFLTQWYLPFLGIYRFREISGLENLPFTPAVYVANHRSRIDALVLLGMLPTATPVIKAAYVQSPLFSAFVRWLDFVPVGQASFSLLSTAVAKCKSVIASGRSLLIFPEGTRATDRRLLAFGDLAFRIATDVGVPVIPVVIHTDFPFMAKRHRSIFPNRTLAMTVRFLPPCTMDVGERPADFADRVRRLLLRELEGLDKGTYWEEI